MNMVFRAVLFSFWTHRLWMLDPIGLTHVTRPFIKLKWGGQYKMMRGMSGLTVSWPYLTQNLNPAFFMRIFRARKENASWPYLTNFKFWECPRSRHVSSSEAQKMGSPGYIFGLSFRKLVTINPMNQKCTMNKVDEHLQVKCTNPLDYDERRTFHCKIKIKNIIYYLHSW